MPAWVRPDFSHILLRSAWRNYKGRGENTKISKKDFCALCNLSWPIVFRAFEFLCDRCVPTGSRCICGSNTFLN